MLYGGRGDGVASLKVEEDRTRGSMHYLALTYDGQKHYKEGEGMGMRVMELQKKLFGEE